MPRAKAETRSIPPSFRQASAYLCTFAWRTVLMPSQTQAGRYASRLTVGVLWHRRLLSCGNISSSRDTLESYHLRRVGPDAIVLRNTIDNWFNPILSPAESGRIRLRASIRNYKLDMYVCGLSHEYISKEAKTTSFCQSMLSASH